MDQSASKQPELKEMYWCSSRSRRRCFYSLLLLLLLVQDKLKLSGMEIKSACQVCVYWVVVEDKRESFWSGCGLCGCSVSVSKNTVTGQEWVGPRLEFIEWLVILLQRQGSESVFRREVISCFPRGCILSENIFVDHTTPSQQGLS